MEECDMNNAYAKRLHHQQRLTFSCLSMNQNFQKLQNMKYNVDNDDSTNSDDFDDSTHNDIENEKDENICFYTKMDFSDHSATEGINNLTVNSPNLRCSPLEFELENIMNSDCNITPSPKNPPVIILYIYICIYIYIRCAVTNYNFFFSVF
jgi:deoxyribodipyrimidine photolyase-like uncharacterized protein